MRKICIVTGSRAEWGLLSSLATLIKEDDDLQLQIIATNMHLSERYGATYKEIESEGFTIDYYVPMDTGGDAAINTVYSMSVAMKGFAEAYDSLTPDMLVVLGDRYEILVAVTAALIFKIPVSHLHGGEITEGAFDDAIRHSITKMSHLHFTSTEEYRQRVIRMGEQPETVFNFGAIGVDNIKRVKLWDKKTTEDNLGGFKLDNNTILVTYHPVTLENNTEEEQIRALLNALDEFPYLRIIFTMPNSDTNSYIIANLIKKWCEQNNDRAIWFISLGYKRYLSILQYIHAVVGNSSSGIIEVPSFGIPTLDIGNRQKGRIFAKSVIHCDINNIISHLQLVLNIKRRKVVNPYEGNDTVRKIFNVIKVSRPSIQKTFYDAK
ncbi:MAG: GDP/UDP-N,N'-diacetylbacillosamine 2-epimerase (hydrolyzing) [Parabacteroides sp.]